VGTATILIVDDEWMNREILQAHLENAGYTVLTANNGAKALEVVAAQSVDLVMLDVRMPGMSGYEVCVRLKSDEATRVIPVLLMTGLDGDDSKQEAVRAGVDDFLMKPFDTLTMLARIRSLIRIRQLNHELARREQALWEALLHYVDEDTARRIVQEMNEQG
jgi:DNA-binding response OmpR family regulator